MENETMKRLRVGMPIYVVKEGKVEGLTIIALFNDFLIARSELGEASLFNSDKICKSFFPTHYLADIRCAIEAGKYAFEQNSTLPADFDAHAAIMSIINADLPQISISSGKTNEKSCLISDSLEFCIGGIPKSTGRISLNKCRMCPALRNYIEAPEHCQFYRDRYRADKQSVSMQMKTFQTDALRKSHNTPIQSQDITDWSKSEIDIVRKCVQNGGTND